MTGNLSYIIAMALICAVVWFLLTLWEKNQ
jgi:hypothetical protein